MEITSWLRFLSTYMKKKKKSKPAIKFQDFHEDIIIDIFVRLPAEDLHRFRLVCKSWFNIIKSPHCIQGHLHNSKPSLITWRLNPYMRAKFPCRYKDDKIRIHDFSPPADYKTSSPRATCFSAACASKSRIYPSVWASCNGLVLFSKSCLRPVDQLFVGNPLTREMSRLPSSTMSNFAYAAHVLGMTYIASTNKYLVLHYYFCSSTLSFGCEILTLGHNTWRGLDTSYLNVRLLYIGSRGVIFIKNIAHVNVKVKEGAFSRDLIISLDVNKEKFYKVTFPFDYRHYQIFEVRGVPSAIYYCSHKKEFEIWVLNDLEKGDWSVEQRIEFDGKWSTPYALATLEDGNIIIFFSSHPIFASYRYFAYDISQKKTTYLDFKDGPKVYYNHIDSLVSCNM